MRIKDLKWITSAGIDSQTPKQCLEIGKINNRAKEALQSPSYQCFTKVLFSVDSCRLMSFSYL